MTPEHRRKISVALKGKVRTPEHCENISKAKMGKPGHRPSSAGLERIRAANLGRVVSDETREKISNAKKGKPGSRTGAVLSEATKQKISKSLTGKKASLETKKKMSLTRKGVPLGPQSPTHKKNLSKAHKGKRLSEETKAKLSAALKGRLVSKETRRKRSESMKQLYETGGLHKRVMDGIKKNFKGGKRECPNRWEVELQGILDRLFPGDYKFVGDGSVVINRMNPDFINVNGQKKIIELFGELFHKPNNKFGWPIPYSKTKRGRKALFKKFGFQTMVVWCSDIDKRRRVSLENKLKRFHTL